MSKKVSFKLPKRKNSDEESEAPKRKRGRPPKEEGAKSVYLHIRMDPAKLDHYKARAKKLKDRKGKKFPSFSACVEHHLDRVFA